MLRARLRDQGAAEQAMRVPKLTLQREGSTLPSGETVVQSERWWCTSEQREMELGTPEE